MNFILSKPAKFDWAADNKDSERIAMDAIPIRGSISGLLKIELAIKPARTTERTDSTTPVETLNIKPAAITSWMFSSLFAALFCPLRHRLFRNVQGGI